MKTGDQKQQSAVQSDDFYERRHSDARYADGDEANKSDMRDERAGAETKFRRRSMSYPKRTTNFNRFVADANHFINQVAARLDVNRHVAAQVTKAVLHAIRDRLPANDAVQFAQGLPLILKGIYFDQYDLSRVPVVIRHPGEFIDYVYYCAGRSAARNFPGDEFIEESVSAVFNALEQTMDYGQVAQVRKMLNDELGYLVA